MDVRIPVFIQRRRIILVDVGHHNRNGSLDKGRLDRKNVIVPVDTRLVDDITFLIGQANIQSVHRVALRIHGHACIVYADAHFSFYSTL